MQMIELNSKQESVVNELDKNIIMLYNRMD